VLSESLLQVTDVIGDEGLSVVARSCKMMRTLEVLHNDAGFITQHGLIGVATGLHLLEKLIFYSADMNSQALQILAHNCPGLTDIRLCHVQKYHASHPVCSLLPGSPPLLD
jgi:transport inhibitor response 1